jgi:hypothetical protein
MFIYGRFAHQMAILGFAGSELRWPRRHEMAVQRNRGAILATLSANEWTESRHVAADLDYKEINDVAHQ